MVSAVPPTSGPGADGVEAVARWNRLAAMLAVILVAGAGLAFEFAYIANADVAWLLTAGRKMSAGARLYTADLVEINPPLIFELSRGAVAVEERTPWSALSVTRVLVAAQAAGLAWFSFRLLERATGRPYPVLLPVAAPLIAGAFAALPAQDFAEREHLIAMWLTPGLLVIACRLEGARVPPVAAIAAGILGGLAVCLKPQFLAVPAAVGLVALVPRPRRIQPEAVAFLGAGLLYALHAAVSYPEYLSTGIPLALDVYVPQTTALSKVVGPMQILLIGGALAAIGAARWWGIRSPAAICLTTAGLASYAVDLAARKGWSYQFLPVKIWLTLGIGFIALKRASQWLAARSGEPAVHVRSRVLVAAALAATLAVALGWSTYRYRRHLESGHYRTTTKLLAAIPADATMANLSPFIFPAFPLAELAADGWSSRYSCLWMLPFTWREDMPQGAAARETVRREVATAMTEDLVRNRPRVLLLDRNSAPAVLDSLGRADGFAAAWQAYRLARTIDGIDIYERRD